ncbi:MOSC domain-containing protein [Spongiimicrobium sp. 3-5]|uniref:MOSC domain-containing protein n=1 Tax=Spongiimicrobium sp. 3-5 TaxID=3332596 RepID=UPI00397FF6C8
MKVIATNIGKATTVVWNGETLQTGIFKYPTKKGITLNLETVMDDTIANRKVHGGVHKACYLFSKDQYPYWQSKYPNLKWDWGMFGENLTVEGLDESELRIGNIYRIGSALVQISQPREPCFKLGIRFGDQRVLKQFIDHGCPGSYVRILEQGTVNAGDELVLETESENTLSIAQFYKLLYDRKKDADLVQLAVDNSALPQYKRDRFAKFLLK